MTIELNAETMLMPFGKYRDRTVAWVIMNDPNYINWSFRENDIHQKYPDYIALIAGHAKDTVEHNAMALRFMSDTVCRKFGHAFLLDKHFDEVYTPVLKPYYQYQGVCLSLSRQLEEDNWDVVLQGTAKSMYVSQKDPLEKIAIPIKDFEVLIELKPKIGEDFPAVMRQVKARPGYRNKTMVIMDEYVGTTFSVQELAVAFAETGMILGDYAFVMTKLFPQACYLGDPW